MPADTRATAPTARNTPFSLKNTLVAMFWASALHVKTYDRLKETYCATGAV